jgi:predicted transcriptional regulator
MIKIEKVQDLRHLDKAVRKVIEKNLKDKNQSPTAFAKEVGIHPLQMLRYINDKKNMRFDTLIQIGKKAKK